LLLLPPHPLRHAHPTNTRRTRNIYHQLIEGAMTAFQTMREAGNLPLLDEATSALERRGACSFIYNFSAARYEPDQACLARHAMAAPANASQSGLSVVGPKPLLVLGKGALGR
jgi:hypothetical protein